MVTGALLDPEGMAVKAVRTLASGHLISGLLRRFLAAPWNVLARVLGNLIALPLGLQQAALGLVVGTTVPASTPADNTRAASPVEPEDDAGPIPPAAPVAVVDLDAERTRHQDAIDEVLAEVEPSPLPSDQAQPERQAPPVAPHHPHHPHRLQAHPTRGRPFSCPEGSSCI